jgi:hypothetical protein
LKLQDLSRSLRLVDFLPVLNHVKVTQGLDAL